MSSSPQQAQAEKLTARGQEQDGLLRRAPNQARPAQALSGAGVARRGKSVYLGTFVTAEKAALCVARTPEGRGAAAERAAAAVPLTRERGGAAAGTPD